MTGGTPCKLSVALAGLCLLLACDTGLRQEDFTRIAAAGVDDRLNSYPWAMEQFDGDGNGTPEVYIGTIADALCIQAPLMSWIDLAIPGFRYLPPARWQCRTDLWGDPRDLTSWEAYYEATYRPARVFRGTYEEGSGTWGWAHAWDPPLELVNGFRGARVFQDALYLTGNGPVDSYVYKTVDGVNFVKASPPGMGTTVLGQSGFRGAQVFRDKLYISSDKACMIFCSADPATDPASWVQANSTGFIASGGGTHQGLYDSGTATAATAGTLTDSAKAWPPLRHVGRQVRITAGAGAGQVLAIRANDAVTLTLAGTWSTIPDTTSAYEIFETGTPDNESIWQLAAFKEHLYAITWNFVTGPECWKSADPAPGNWTRVIAGGFGNPHVGFMSIHPFGDHLYIGTATYPPLFAAGAGVEGTEILRLDKDDNVELVVGKAREAGVAASETVSPISGLGQGFNHLWNFYTWYMGAYEGWLYVGTCDFNGMVKDSVAEYFGGEIPAGFAWLADLLLGQTGFDLWRTQNGVHWVRVSDTGFGDHDSYGIRNLMATQWGLFAGVANAVDGFEVWLGK